MIIMIIVINNMIIMIIVINNMIIMIIVINNMIIMIIVINNMIIMIIVINNMIIMIIVINNMIIMIIVRVSYRGGGALGYPPPRSSFPPPRISYHNVIMNQIENCTSINAYRLMRLFFCLNMSKISAKLTEFSSGPSIAIRMSVVKLESFNRFRSRVFIIFI